MLVIAFAWHGSADLPVADTAAEDTSPAVGLTALVIAHLRSPVCGNNFRCMPSQSRDRRRRLIALSLVLAVTWEAFWLSVYLTAPRPDYHMRSVAAIVFGLWLPVSVFGSIAIVIVLRRLMMKAGK